MSLKQVSEGYFSNGVDIKMLSDEIDSANVVTDYDGVSQDNGSISVLGGSISDSPALDSILANHNPDNIDTVKQAKIESIDNKTQTLITYGFTYDGNNFSLSAAAQINWVGLKTSIDSGMLTCPIAVTTKDDVEYIIQDSTSFDAFYLTGLGTKNNHITTGRVLKLQVNNSTTKAEVDAVIDNR